MKELDETTIRANVRRRAGGDPDPAKLDHLFRSIALRLRDQRRAGLGRRLALVMPLRARVGFAAVVVLALSLGAVPFAGGPRASAPGTTAGSTTASTLEPNAVQLLSLAELQRVAALGDREPYAHKVVVASVDVEPPPAEAIPGCTPGCPGSVAASNPRVLVYKPAADTDMLHWTIPDQGIAGPVIVRIRGVNSLELVGAATVAADRSVAWSVPSFVRAADELPRTMDLRPNEFSVGPAFVVDGKLAQGPGLFCALQTQSTDRIAEFECGVVGWLAPTEVTDPTVVIDGWSRRPADWVRLQNGSYQTYAHAEDSLASPSGGEAVRGLYVVFPVLKYNATMCFQCDAGAVGFVYARLEAIATP
jgi:hypothetical protein